MKNIQEIIRGNDSVSLEFSSANYTGNLTFVNNAFWLDKELYGADGKPLSDKETFIEMLDTPTTYAGHIGDYVRVNNTGDGVIFVTGQDPSVGTVWGEITGTLSNQTDVQNQFDSKEDSLGNPSADHQVLSSLIDGTRSWVDAASLSDVPQTTDDLPEGNTNFYFTESRVTNNTEVTLNTLNRHTHTNKAVLDLIINTGTGIKFLADDGVYREVTGTGGTSDHSALINRSLADQHPISAITNLQGILNTIPTNTDHLTEGTSNLYYKDSRVSTNSDVLANTNARHTHANKGVLDVITSTGDGTLFLANDGSYKAGGSGGVSVHNDLTGRDATNAHPVSAITNLQSALDSKFDKAGGSISGDTDVTGDFKIISPTTGRKALKVADNQTGADTKEARLYAGDSSDYSSMGAAYIEGGFPDGSVDGTLEIGYRLKFNGNRVWDRGSAPNADLVVASGNGELYLANDGVYKKVPGEKMEQDAIINKATTDSFASIQTQIDALPDNLGGNEIILILADGTHNMDNDVFTLEGKYNGRLRIEASTIVNAPTDSQVSIVSMNGTGYFKFINCYLNIDIAYIAFESTNTGSTIFFNITGNTIVTTTGCRYQMGSVSSDASLWYSAGAKIVSYNDYLQGNSSRVISMVKFLRGNEVAQGGMLQVFSGATSLAFDYAANGKGLAAFDDANALFVNKVVNGAIDISAVGSGTSTADVAQVTTPTITNISETGGTLSATSNRAGVIYWMARLTSYGVASTGDIINGTNGANAISNDVVTCLANVAITDTITDGSGSSDYTLWVFAEDENGNKSEVRSAEFTTAAADTTAPTLTSATVENATPTTITLVFSENIQGTNLGFSLSGTTSTGFSSISISGSTLTATLSDAVAYGETVLLSYDSTTGDIADTSSNALASITNFAVTNNVADSTAPTITGYVDTNLNTSVDITVSEGVYGANDGSTPVAASDLQITNFVASGATALAISSITDINDNALSGGETTIRVVLSWTGTPDGTETFQVQPIDGTSIYDAAGNAMASTETSGTITAAGSIEQLAAPYLITTIGNTKLGMRWGYNANAVSYSLFWKLHTDTNYTEISGITNEWYQLTGLTNGVDYDFYAIARGDGVNYSDSDPSLEWTKTPSDTPALPTMSINTNNSNLDTYIAVDFSTRMFSDENASVAITESDFQVTNFVGSGATAASVLEVTNHNYGQDCDLNVASANIYFAYTGLPDGNETFDVQPASGTALYDIAGNAMAATHSISITLEGAESNSVTDGTFPSGTTAWTFGGGWSLGTNAASYDNVTNDSVLFQDDVDMAIPLKRNTTYQVTFDIAISSGNANLSIWHTNGTAAPLVGKASYANGSHTVEFTTNYIYGYDFAFMAYNDSDNAFTITNVVLREV